MYAIMRFFFTYELHRVHGALKERYKLNITGRSYHDIPSGHLRRCAPRENENIRRCSSLEYVIMTLQNVEVFKAHTSRDWYTEIFSSNTPVYPLLIVIRRFPKTYTSTNFIGQLLIVTICPLIIRSPSWRSPRANELRTNCSPIGHNNTKNFLCLIRSHQSLDRLEIVR